MAENYDQREPFAPQETRFVLVYDRLDTGGIETLILRFSGYLKAQGFEPCICCKPGGELQKHVTPGVRVINYGGISELRHRLRQFLDIGVRLQNVVFVSFDAAPAALSVLLDVAVPKSTRVVALAGVFHPKAYFMPGQPLDRLLLNRLLAIALGIRNMFFMNEECRLEHAKQWKADLSSSSIIALPIDQREPTWRARMAGRVRIVSVGRLVDFKAYNLGAARIVKACLDQGLEVSWDIYGYGVLASTINDLVTALGVANHVTLHGELDYTKFSEIVSEFDLFVGMGTAVIEAAALGVPSICALIDEEAASYGYVSDLPFGNVGEVIEGRPALRIEDLIVGYANLSAEERDRLSGAEIAAASRYGMAPFFDSVLQLANQYSPSTNLLARHSIAWFYYLMTDGIVARTVLGRGLKTKLAKLLRWRA